MSLLGKMAAISHFIIMSLCIAAFAFSFATSARIRRALDMESNGSRLRCLSGTITERNKTSSVILTGTVIHCESLQVKGMYSCRIQVSYDFLKEFYFPIMYKLPFIIKTTTPLVLSELRGRAGEMLPGTDLPRSFFLLQKQTTEREGALTSASLSPFVSYRQLKTL